MRALGRTAVGTVIKNGEALCGEPGWSQTAMDSAVMPSTTKRSSGEHGRLNLTSIHGIHHGMTVVTDQRQIRSSGH